MAKYPEHEKLSAVKDHSQVCGEFLDWIEQQGIHLAQYGLNDANPNRLFPAHQTTLSLLAGFFEIDQTEIDKEKNQMLAEIRAAQ